VCIRSGLPVTAVLAGNLSLGEFAATIAAARLVVSADTGAAHLASAYSTPSVVLFGPAPPEIWGPPPGPHLVLTRADLRRGDTFAADPDPALLAVSVQDVLAAVRDLGVL
jgi:ADP-heptose:LPS heptosyltransferase